MRQSSIQSCLSFSALWLIARFCAFATKQRR
jgi:hypothetical protein